MKSLNEYDFGSPSHNYENGGSTIFTAGPHDMLFAARPHCIYLLPFSGCLCGSLVADLAANAFQFAFFGFSERVMVGEMNPFLFAQSTLLVGEHERRVLANTAAGNAMVTAAK